MDRIGLKVGQLAGRTGLTVRTLHHYDAIGLLSPSSRTESGHRLYSGADLALLTQILSLRQLGFTLEEIRSFLHRPDARLEQAVQMRLDRLREQIALQQDLCRRLEQVLAGLQTIGTVSVETLLQTMEAMQLVESYYTEEQRKKIAERAAQLGDEAIRQGERDWADLIASIDAEMAAGTDPNSPRVKALAEKWKSLVQGFTGGDAGIHQGLQKMWDTETNIHGFDTAQMRARCEYIGL